MTIQQHVGFRLGHGERDHSGCTVALFDRATVASGEIRGGSPATREFDLLEPQRANQGIDAVVLSGGSVFGLASVDGVVRHLAEQGRGVRFGNQTIPIVPAMGIFDLNQSRPTPPTAETGIAACESATADIGPFGPVGAGLGATVGQWRGISRPSGIGWSYTRFRDVIVEAVVVVNAFGEPGQHSAIQAKDRFHWPEESFLPAEGGNTTIGVVSTNAMLNKLECHLIAQGAHDGLARAITPPHTRADGDGFIAAATGTAKTRLDPDVVRTMAMTSVETAIQEA
ncbi:P1 family peptidase [Haloglycomyces albus]|uniref:P1 family peptidase n=1 Tax=Haloglycomyces albus TaxID=526067 RepID=UPI0004B1AE13|nr:P1 family peptidase [Haloglycomyces albus]